jgi:Holliday junction resolvase
MPSTNSRRAKRHEREVVRQAEAKGLEAERAWNSDGRSLGETEETDVLIRHPEATVMDATRVQCKRRKSVAQYLTCEDADVVVTREDHGENLAVVPLGHYLDLLRHADEDSP